MKKNLLKTIIVLFITIVSSLQSKATYYTFTGPGNWSDPTKWGGVYPGTTLSALDQFKIIGVCNLNVNVTNNSPQLTIGNPFGTDNATFIINNSITFTNNNVIATFNTGSNIEVNGNFTNNISGNVSDSVIIKSLGVFDNYSQYSANGFKCVNNGIYTNYANAIMYCPLLTLNSSGIVNNNGNWYNQKINNIDGVFNNNTTGLFGNYFSASLVTLNINPTGIFNNYGKDSSFNVTNIYGTYNNYGQLKNVGNNQGILTVKPNGILKNNSRALFTQDGDFYVNGIFENNASLIGFVKTVVLNNTGSITGNNGGFYNLNYSSGTGGALSPGIAINDISTMTFSSSAVLTNCTLNFDIASNISYDKINVGSTATFSSTTNINVTFLPTYTPTINDGFTLMSNGYNSGTPNLNLPTLPSGMYWASNLLNGKVLIKILGSPYIAMNTFTNTTVPTLCPGTTFTVSIGASDGLAPFQYSDGGSVYQASSTFTLNTKTHTFYIKDAMNNTINKYINFTQFTDYSPGANATMCFGQAATTVTLTPTVAGFQYSFNGSAMQTSNIFTITTAGTYTFQEISNNGCIKNSSITITQNPQIPISAISATPLACTGASTSTINVQVPNSVLGSPSSKLNAGSYSFMPNTTGAGYYYYANYTVTASGVYTVTIKVPNGCNTYTTIAVSTNAPTLSASSTNANCVSAIGTLTFNAVGGGGTYTYSVNNVANTSPYSAPVGTYTVSVLDNNSCSSFKTVIVNLASNPTLTVSSTDAPCSANGSLSFNANGGGSTYSYTVNNITSTSPNSAPIGTYTIVVVDDNQCSNSQIISITNAPYNNLAQANNTNINSVAGTTLATFTQADNTIVDYIDANCLLICKLQDANNGTALGSVNASVEVSGANTISHIAMPYIDRVYTITPTVQTSAIVTLYYTNDDILKYNANCSPLNPFAINLPSSSIANGTSMMVNITKLSGSTNSNFSVPAIWDATAQRWSATFPIASFSTFFTNTLPSAPLSVTLLNFTAKKIDDAVIFNWQTTDEKNNDKFEIEKSTDGINFETITSVKSKQNNSNNSYEYTDATKYYGTFYFRLKMIDVDGNYKYSNTEIITQNENLFMLENTIVTNNLIVSSIKNMNCIIYNMQGKEIQNFTISKGQNNIDVSQLSTGLYILKSKYGTTKFSKTE